MNSRKSSGKAIEACINQSPPVWDSRAYARPSVGMAMRGSMMRWMVFGRIRREGHCHLCDGDGVACVGMTFGSNRQNDQGVGIDAEGVVSRTSCRNNTLYIQYVTMTGGGVLTAAVRRRLSEIGL